MSDQNKPTNLVASTSKVFTIVFLALLAGEILTCCYRCKPREGLGEITTVKVYFTDGEKRQDCNCDDPVIRVIPKTKDLEKVAFLALEELIKGPTEEEQAQGYSACLPGEGLVILYKERYEKMVAKYEITGENIDWWG